MPDELDLETRLEMAEIGLLAIKAKLAEIELKMSWFESEVKSWAN